MQLSLHLNSTCCQGLLPLPSRCRMTFQSRVGGSTEMSRPTSSSRPCYHSVVAGLLIHPPHLCVTSGELQYKIAADELHSLSIVALNLFNRISRIRRSSRGKSSGYPRIRFSSACPPTPKMGSAKQKKRAAAADFGCGEGSETWPRRCFCSGGRTTTV